MFKPVASTNILINKYLPPQSILEEHWSTENYIMKSQSRRWKL